jgi:hypothetical protein
MKKFSLLFTGVLIFLLSLSLLGCVEETLDECDEDDEDEEDCVLTGVLEDEAEGSDDFGSGEWHRQATYTDGVDMGSEPAVLTFFGDGTFVSSTAFCTASGNYTVNVTEEDAPETMTMSYVQSDCPGFTLSALTYAFEMSANEEGQEVMTFNAEYAGHLVTEVYTR